ncbi:MAG: F0F1 ATP synthase subunit delta [Clostridiales bacterium]|nr:F0F1 ATP synthase subunit delta [Clostridiales bacterium]
MSEQDAGRILPSPNEERDKTLLRGRVVSGMPLSQAARKRIVQHFEALLGCHVTLSSHVDQTLIAGVRVEINGRAYDGSLRGQLTNVRKMLTRYDEEEL